MQSLRDSLTATRHRVSRRERLELRSQRQAARLKGEVAEATQTIAVGFSEMHRAVYAFTSHLTSIWRYFPIYFVLLGASVGIDELLGTNPRLNWIWMGLYYVVGPLYRRFCRTRGYDKPIAPIGGDETTAVAPAASALSPVKSGPSLPQLMRSRRRV